MDVEGLIGIVALAVALVCVGSGLYVRAVWQQVLETPMYRQIDGQAPFLRRLVSRNLRVSAASGVLAAMIAYSYLSDPLPRPWGAVIVGCCLLAYMWGPISDALLWRRERKAQ